MPRKALILLLLLPACQRAAPKEGDAIGRPGEPWLLVVDAKDAELRDATEHAQASLDPFLQALEAPRPEQSHFLVKAAFGGDALWVGTLHWDGTEFGGKLSNAPFASSELSAGAEVNVARGDVLDWMYVERGKLRGGYTIRVLRERLARADRAKFEQAWPFGFE